MKDLIMLAIGVGIGIAIAKTMQNTEGAITPALPETKCLKSECVTSVSGFKPPQHVF